MAEQQLESVVRRLQHLAAVELTDAQLLERYTTHRDADAFNLIVRRHGPLVWRVCRRVLGDADGADDCFQATFLVLARRAGSIRKPAVLASWLHGVAFRVASEARAGRTPSAALSTVEPLAATAEPVEQAACRELACLVEEEVHALPEKLRLAVLACYWQGLTNEEAALQLGWPAGTVKTRLARAREVLHRRLVKRGVTVPVGVVALLCAPAGAEAMLPVGCITTAVGSGSTVSAPVAALAAAVLRGAAMSQARLAVAVMLVVSLVAAGVGAWWAERRPPQDAVRKADAEQGAAQPPRPPADNAKPARVDRLGDPLPDGALLRLGTLRHRDLPEWLGHAQLLPDGRTCLRSTGAETIDWVDIATGRCTESWRLPEGMSEVGFSHDGRRALFTKDKTYSLWDLTARKEIRSFARPGDILARMGAIFSDDDQVVVAFSARVGYGASDLTRFFDVATGRQLWQLNWKRNAREQVVGFVNGTPAVVLLDPITDRAILRDRTSGKELRSFATMPVNDARSWGLSPDGQALVMGTSTGAVRVWDIAGGKERPSLDGHKQEARRFAFSPDGKRVMTGGSDRSAIVREWPSGKLVKALDLGKAATTFGVSHMHFMPGGKQAAITIGPEIAQRCFDLASGKELPRDAEAHNGFVCSLAIDPDNRLVSGGYDDTLRVWDLDSGRQCQAFNTGALDTGAPWTAVSLALSADGRIVATGHPNHGTVRLHERSSGRLVRTLTTGGIRITRLAFVPGAKGLLACGVINDLWVNGGPAVSNFIALWDVNEGKEIRRFPNASRPAVSLDGRRLAAFLPGRPVLWHLEDGQEREFPAEGLQGELRFSPDGRLLAMDSPKGVVLWEVASGQECLRIDVASEGYQALAFSPDGRWLARADKSAVQLLDGLRGKRVRQLVGHAAWVQDMLFTPDGRRIASASFDSTILVWDASGLTAVAEAPINATALAAAWDALAKAEAKAAYEGIGNLAASPGAAVPFLRARLHPAKLLPARQLQQWIGALDNEDFEKRQAATQALEQGGGQAEVAIAAALTRKTNLEARRRLQAIQKKLREAPSSGGRRAIRAVWALELIASPDACAVLQRVAEGAPGAWETRDARAALERLKKRDRHVVP